MRILLLETIAIEASDMFNEGNVESIENFDKSIRSDIDLSTIDGIITRGIGLVSKELIDQCSNLKVIARCGIGLNNIDVKYASSKKIKVINAPGSNASTVAEHTLALMLTATRDVYHSLSEVKKGNWLYRNSFKADELRGKKLGIIGLGNIGKKVAKMAEAFDMEVSYWSRSKKDSPYKYESLEDLLQTSDIISVHIELNDDTRGIIDKRKLQLCNKNTIIINTARAEIFQINDLKECMEDQVILAFAADVPMPTEEVEIYKELMLLPTVYITPHVSSLTNKTFVLMCTEVVENVIRELNGLGAFERNVANGREIK